MTLHDKNKYYTFAALLSASKFNYTSYGPKSMKSKFSRLFEISANDCCY